jgi:hypothetical protein
MTGSITEDSSYLIPWEKGPAGVKSYMLRKYRDPERSIAVLNRVKSRIKDPKKLQVLAKTLILLSKKPEKPQLSHQNHLSIMKNLVESGSLPRGPKPELARVMGLRKEDYLPGSEGEEKKKLAVLLAYKGWKRFSRKHPVASRLIKRGFLTGLLLGTVFLVSALFRFSFSLGWLSGWWPFGAAKKSIEAALDAVSGAQSSGTDTVDVDMTFIKMAPPAE